MKSLEEFVKQFISDIEPNPIDGEYYDLPGKTVYNTYTRKFKGGRLEVNQITPDTPSEFEWATELTLNDKTTGEFVHLILLRDGSRAETYGKNVIPIEPEREAEILSVLSNYSSL